MTLAIEDERFGRGVAAALRGPGGPAGIVACEANGRELTIAYDDAMTSSAVVRHLIEVELAARDADIPSDLGELARIAARGLDDPQLDERRVIEWHVP
ncbi:MAG TPA: hypothetical protein VN905_01435 [Candidatus Binatia bacterium]|nr:hypothetical protein [Candidatus Binatia bacterium]